MIVLKSKYKELEDRLAEKDNSYRVLQQETLMLYEKLNATRLEFKRLQERWNDLVDRINGKGGMEFLDRAEIPSSISTGLTQEDIRRLLQLCHPDKHGGKKIASEMTAKLLSLRE